jgi:hypothetical protein
MAAQSFGWQSHIIAPHIMGYFIPNISVMAVFISFYLINFIINNF